MGTLKHGLLLAAILVLPVAALGADEGARLERVDADTMKALHAATPQTYPKAHAVMIRDYVEAVIDKKWHGITTQYALYRVLRHNGVQQLKTLTIPYNPDYQKATVIMARTISPNGTATTVKSEAIRSVDIPSGIIKTNRKALTAVFPGVNIGSGIEYKVRIEDFRNPMGKSFMHQSFFATLHPIVDCRYKFSHPPEVPVRYKQYHLSLTPKTERNDKLVTYLFEKKNIPAIEIEPNTPPGSRPIPRVAFGGTLNWDEIASRAYRLMSGQIKETGTVKRNADRLASLLRDSSTKSVVKAMYYFVSQGISYVAFEYGDNAWKPHTPEDVITNKYGDCKDGATLLVSILRCRGIQSYQALVRTSGKGPLNKDMPYMGQFDHCIACVPKPDGKGYWWLDTTTKIHMLGTIPAGNQGCEALVLNGEKATFVTIPMSKMKDNCHELEMDISFGKDARAEVTASLSSTGVFKAKGMAEGYRMKIMGKDKLQEQMRQSDPTFELVRYDNSLKSKMDLDAPFTTKLEYYSRNILIDTGHALVLDLSKISPFRTLRFREKRKSDYLASAQGAPNRNIVTCKVKIPSGFAVSDDGLPTQINRENDLAKIVRRVTQKGNVIEVYMELSIKKLVVPVSKYRGFTELFKGTAATGAVAKLVLLKEDAVPSLGKAKEEKKAEALLSNGKNFLMNNMHDRARKVFLEVLAVYPDTKAAKRAKLELQKLE